MKALLPTQEMPELLILIVFKKKISSNQSLKSIRLNGQFPYKVRVTIKRYDNGSGMVVTVLCILLHFCVCVM